MNELRFYVYIYKDPTTGIPFYVGKGSGSRKRHHIREAKKDKSVRQPQVNKIKSLLKKGLEPEILLYAFGLEEQAAFDIEKKLIIKYGRRDKKTGCLLNMTDGGEGAAGISEETFHKRSAALKGRIVTEETRRKISQSNMGRTTTEETRRKLSEAGKKRIMSKETKEKMSKTHKTIINKSLFKKGHHPSGEAICKTADALRGRNITEEHKKRISEANIGRKRGAPSEETRKKISDAMKGRIPVNVFKEGHIVSKETGRKISETKKKKSKEFYEAMTSKRTRNKLGRFI